MQVPGVEQSDIPHADEHSLEVHLPFLQLVLGDFTLVPVIVGGP
jgi:AmmeMemoRadiSam system protein B